MLIAAHVPSYSMHCNRDWIIRACACFAGAYLGGEIGKQENDEEGVVGENYGVGKSKFI
jgi:hypothetical protein